MTLSFRNYLSGDEKIRLTSSVIILSENNKLLLELRSDCNLWGLIGGAVNVGEDPKCTACRECEEDRFSIVKNNLSLLDVYGDISEYRVLDFKDNLFHSIDIVYFIFLKNIDNLKISNESLDLKLVDINYLNFSTIVKPAIRPIKDFIDTKLK